MISSCGDMYTVHTLPRNMTLRFYVHSEAKKREYTIKYSHTLWKCHPCFIGQLIGNHFSYFELLQQQQQHSTTTVSPTTASETKLEKNKWPAAMQNHDIHMPYKYLSKINESPNAILVFCMCVLFVICSLCSIRWVFAHCVAHLRSHILFNRSQCIECAVVSIMKINIQEQELAGEMFSLPFKSHK